MFKDPNLHLAVVEALCQAGVFAYPKHAPNLHTELFNWPIAEHLAQVKELRWSPEAGLIPEMLPDWDGEDNYFNLKIPGCN